MCVAGSTIEETIWEIRAAIELRIEEMIEDRLPMPQPTSIVQYIEVSV